MESSEVNIINALENIVSLFLDTSPVIYYVEKNPRYFSTVKPVFDRIDDGLMLAVTSPVTLAECLVGTYRLGLMQFQNDFFDLIVYGDNTRFMPIDYDQACLSADLRAKYRLALSYAFQIATALTAGCDAFLTNDAELKRITEIKVLVLDDLKAID
jgi:predicted nucleic acid-binding protein